MRSQKILRYAQNDRRDDRSGITLIELLVVVGIMMLLLVVALPAATPPVEARRMREAARAIDVYFGAARNQAIVTGRPAGVMLQRIPGRPEGCLTLYQVEVPPSYSGDPLDCKMLVQYAGQDPNSKALLFTALLQTGGLILPGLVHVNDLIQFNGQGPMYRIVDGTVRPDGTIVPTPKAFTLALDPWLGAQSPFQAARGAALFRIIRQPIRSVAPPLELPATTAIDLVYSGTQGDLTAFRPAAGDTAPAGGTPPTPVVIMFSPNGSIDRVYYSNNNNWSQLFGESIYLMLGKRERIPAASSPDGIANWADTKCLWITIAPKSGMVLAKEVFPVTNPPANSLQKQLLMSQALARQAEGLGGR